MNSARVTRTGPLAPPRLEFIFNGAFRFAMTDTVTFDLPESPSCEPTWERQFFAPRQNYSWLLGGLWKFRRYRFGANGFWHDRALSSFGLSVPDIGQMTTNDGWVPSICR